MWRGDAHFDLECPVGDHSFVRLVEPYLCHVNIRVDKEITLVCAWGYSGHIDEVVGGFRAIPCCIRHGQGYGIETRGQVGVGRVLFGGNIAVSKGPAPCIRGPGRMISKLNEQRCLPGCRVCGEIRHRLNRSFRDGDIVGFHHGVVVTGAVRYVQADIEGPGCGVGMDRFLFG